MALSKNNHMSKAAEQMGFAGDFDAGLATEEKQRAAHEFDGLVRSALSGFAGSTVNFDHSGGVNGVGSYLTLSVPQEDGSSIGIVVSSATLDDGSNERRINVQAVRNNATGDASHSYYIENGQVLRLDREPSELPSAKASTKNIEGLAGLLLMPPAVGLSSNLERQTSVNLHSVGLDEVSKLAELLVSAQPVKQ